MPTYILSKLKRSIAGDKIGDLIDLEAPTAALTEIEDADSILIFDDTDNKFKIITGTALKTWLNSNVAPAWGKVTGKPDKFPPSTHEHAASEVTSGVFDAARIPTVPQLLTLPNPADRTITENDAYTSTLAAATGGTVSYTYSLTGSLPTGMTFDVATRALSGTPSVEGSFELTYRVTDSGSGSQQQSRSEAFILTVQPEGSRYIAVSTSKASAGISAATISAGKKHDIHAQRLTLPLWGGNRFIVIAQPADRPDLTRISLAGLGNSVSDFVKASFTRTIAGVDYELWISDEKQGSAIAGEVIEVLP